MDSGGPTSASATQLIGSNGNVFVLDLAVGLLGLKFGWDTRCPR
jgi:hypothetical protein